MTRLHCVTCDAYFDSDGERHVCPVRYTKVGNYYVRRPQAQPMKRLDITGREVVEILAATAVWCLLLTGLILWLAIAAVAS